jgi:DNA-binding response OmpR family regulator
MINVSPTPDKELSTEPVKVIVAEDEVLVRLMLAEGLREAGFRVLEASKADEAIALMKSIGADAVVTDLQMATPEDGLVVARYVRDHHAGTPVLLASVMAAPIDGCPFDAFFIKPCKPEDIAAWIKRRRAATSDPIEGALP